MSLGLLLGATSTYFLLRSSSSSFALAKDDTTNAAIVGSLYWTSSLSAILYPGTDSIDPEFKHRHGPDQRVLFSTYLSVLLVGYFFGDEKAW
jgi:hypothetical protein